MRVGHRVLVVAGTLWQGDNGQVGPLAGLQAADAGVKPKGPAPPSVPSSKIVARLTAGNSRATCRTSASRSRSGDEARLSVPRATTTPAANIFSSG